MFDRSVARFRRAMFNRETGEIEFPIVEVHKIGTRNVDGTELAAYGESPEDAMRILNIRVHHAV